MMQPHVWLFEEIVMHFNKSPSNSVSLMVFSVRRGPLSVQRQRRRAGRSLSV